MENKFIKIFDINYQISTVEKICSTLISQQEKILLVTPNIHHLYRIRKDPKTLKLYTNSTICVNDSRVLNTTLKLFKNIEIGHCCGSDITEKLLNAISKSNKNMKINIIGLETDYFYYLNELFFQKKNLHITHTKIPENCNINKRELVNHLGNSTSNNYDYYFIAIGSPKQEIIGNYLLKNIYNNASILCIGASLDYLTGKEKRAPLILRKINLEWAYRFFNNPRRLFRRYFIESPVALFDILRNK